MDSGDTWSGVHEDLNNTEARNLFGSHAVIIIFQI